MYEQEREELFQAAKKPAGTRCGLCLRYIKVYKRKINPKMARWLIQLVRRYAVEPRWYSVSDHWSTKINSRENSKLDWWGLVEERPKEEEQTGRTSGYWKPTPAGTSFARRECAVSKYKFIYKGEVIFEEGPLVTIDHCLDDDFDYGELMREGL